MSLTQNFPLTGNMVVTTGHEKMMQTSHLVYPVSPLLSANNAAIAQPYCTPFILPPAIFPLQILFHSGQS